ncbi:MAG: rhodanese-like domain-containing protein [Methylotenera sp.]|nr:rhodanese-like domain-containing protein [Oligoflexia bacterium]
MSAPEWIITTSELKTILALNPKSVVLLDVREPEEFEESRIEGCTLIPLGEISLRAATELDKAADIVIYCAHGVRSMHALMAMKMLGFQKLRSLEGGICAFQDGA